MLLKSVNRSLISAFLLSGVTQSVYAVEADVNVIGDITVTGTREETSRAETAETVGTLDQKEIQAIKPAHPSEIFERIPGVHVNVTGGEGHMMSIRQPISTKPLYLYLEDGIPTRSTGFFNHNALYEVNVPQSAGVEVTKGPGTSLYGSDAIGGVINILSRPTPLEAEASLSLEAGEFGWQRLMMSAGNGWDEDGLRADLNLTHTDGWRDATDYDRQSANSRWDHVLENGANVKTLMAVSDIDQQTAGSSRLSETDYLNNPTLNYTPISFRKVEALRLSSAYEKESRKTLLSVTPYVRQNSMEYIANWSLSYDPARLKTESDSVGMLVKYRMDFEPNRTRLIVGADIDYTPGSRIENSINTTKTGSIYTSYTLGQKIYDYDVTYQGISPYVHVETSPSDKLRLTAGLRYDNMSYDYDNKMADGLLTFTPGGMSRDVDYNHPSDAKVDFSRFSPKLGAAYSFSEQLNGFVSYRHAFRAPSEGQLFRPGSNTTSLQLDPVKVNSYEIGVRGKPAKGMDYEVSVYYMVKKDDLVTFEDPATSDRFTANAGETLHKGIEVGVNSKLAEKLKLGVSFAHSKHTYEDWVEKGTDFGGNEIQSAPKNIANVRLNYNPEILNGGRAELEWVHLGKYWMDANNTVKYDGHDIYNLRMNYFVSKQMEVFARLMNVGDERYATSASFSRGASTFAPGMPRTFYAGAEYKF